jgi:hypothetical protein
VLEAWGGLIPSLPHGGMKDGEVVGGHPGKVLLGVKDDHFRRSSGICAAVGSEVV